MLWDEFTDIIMCNHSKLVSLLTITKCSVLHRQQYQSALSCTCLLMAFSSNDPMIQWYHSLGRSVHNMKLSCFKFKTCCSWSAATNAALVFSLCNKATWCFISVINGEIAMIILSGLKHVHEFLKFDCKELSHLKIRLSKACEPIHKKTSLFDKKSRSAFSCWG